MCSCVIAVLLYVSIYNELQRVSHYAQKISALYWLVCKQLDSKKFSASSSHNYHRCQPFWRQSLGLTTLNAFVFVFVPDIFIITDFLSLKTKYGVLLYVAVLAKICADVGQCLVGIPSSVIHYCRHEELRSCIMSVLSPLRSRFALPLQRVSQHLQRRKHFEESSVLRELHHAPLPLIVLSKASNSSEQQPLKCHEELL